MKPIPGQHYSLEQVFQLELLDSPSLMCCIEGEPSVIQDSHCTSDELVASPLGGTQWRYVRTTSEWVPLFQFVGPGQITEFVTWEKDINSDGFGSWFWVCPKTLPRLQVSYD